MNALERAGAIVADSEAPGYLHRSTLRFVIDGAPTPVDAYLELPNRLAIADERIAGAATAGVRERGTAARSACTLSFASPASPTASQNRHSP